jgi:hypothetical protein
VADGERKVCVARHAAEGGLEADYAAKCGGDADAAAAICSQRYRNYAGGNSARAAAAAAPGEVGGVVGVSCASSPRVVAARTYSDLVHVCDSNDYGAGCSQPRDRLCIFGRNVGNKLRAVAVPLARNLKLHLHCDGDTVEQA